jgi:hypothetical protein
MLPYDLLLHITSFLSFRDSLSLYLTSKEFNFCLQNSHKKAVIIQKKFRHRLTGKVKRQNLLYKYCTELYNFKPFVICRVFDYSSLYIYRKNNRDFLHQVIRHLTVLHNRSEEDEEDSTLLTEHQKALFNSVLDQKNIDIQHVKMLLRTLSTGQLAYVR